MYKKINSYMANQLSKYITGVRKDHKTQQFLITMLEKWKNVFEKGEYASYLFMDLSKAFDTINHDLLLAKLKSDGFSNKSLSLLYSYLKNRKRKLIIILVQKKSHCRSSTRVYPWTTII